MNYDSIKNQRIIGDFVNREVKACLTSEVEFILKQSFESSANDAPFTFDDVENYYRHFCDDCGEGHTRFTESEDENGEIVYTCDDCGRTHTEEEHDNLDTEQAEVFEWWLVTDWLAEKLKARGEVVIMGFSNYWGRQGSGQAIHLDYVMGAICEGMGILEGQEHDWSRK
jgi:predicted RNA-binding Zn-ribbon protein involved in translation (DUF1610 family)